MQQRHKCMSEYMYNVTLHLIRIVIRCKWLLLFGSTVLCLYKASKASLQTTSTFLQNGTISEECVCFYKNQTYDFCYILPHDKSVRGLRFNCTYASNLEKLGLLSSAGAIDLNLQKMPQPAFIAAISQNHFKEGITMLANFRAMFPRQKIFVYDLGLQPESRKEIEGKCLVEMRNFPFNDYHLDVKRLTQYGWKAILIAMTVQEFGAVWYMDTSIRWMGVDTDKKLDWLERNFYVLLEVLRHAQQSAEPVGIALRIRECMKYY